MDVLNSVRDMHERGYRLSEPPINVLSYDPAGDGQDNDALVILSREEWRRGELIDPDLSVEFLFRVLLAHRLPKGIEFPDKLAIVLRVNRAMLKWQRQKRQYAHVIAVETNGVGYAMASSLRKKTPVPIFGYVTVGNASDKPFEEKHISMPRLAALDNLRVWAELQRVKIAKDCEGAHDLISEMNSFVWRRAGRPEAIEGQHDDLVMALAGAMWVATKLIPTQNKQVKISPRKGIISHRDRLQQGNIRIQ